MQEPSEISTFVKLCSL